MVFSVRTRGRATEHYVTFSVKLSQLSGHLHSSSNSNLLCYLLYPPTFAPPTCISSFFFPKPRALESPIVLWSKLISFFIVFFKKRFIAHSLFEKNVSSFLNSISLPVTGCPANFSTSGVLDSAGKANVSFLAEKKERKSIYFLIVQCPTLPYGKHNQSQNVLHSYLIILCVWA